MLVAWRSPIPLSQAVGYILRLIHLGLDLIRSSYFHYTDDVFFVHFGTLKSSNFRFPMVMISLILVL